MPGLVASPHNGISGSPDKASISQFASKVQTTTYIPYPNIELLELAHTRSIHRFRPPRHPNPPIQKSHPSSSISLSHPPPKTNHLLLITNLIQIQKIKSTNSHLNTLQYSLLTFPNWQFWISIRVDLTCCSICFWIYYFTVEIWFACADQLRRTFFLGILWTTDL